MTDEKKPTFKAPPMPLKSIRMPGQPGQTPAAPVAPTAVKTGTTPPASPTPTPMASAPSAPTVKPSTPHILNAGTQAEGIPTEVPTSKTPAKYPAEAYMEHNFAQELNLPPKVLETKVMGSILGGLFFFGIMMGCVMSGDSGTQTVQGLTDVVINQDIRYRLPRCGQTNLNNECVLYIMNAKTFDRLGSDFFQEAQNITGIPQYTIRLSNVQYANALIRPGYIAQIYIPARK